MQGRQGYQKQTQLISKNKSQHRPKRLHQLRNLLGLRLSRFASRTTQLVLLLDPAPPLGRNGIELVFFGAFIGGVRARVRDGEVVEIGLDLVNTNTPVKLGAYIPPQVQSHSP